jgi:DNA polymerase-3 subunit delta'
MMRDVRATAFGEILGHEDTLELLQRMLERGRIAPSLLFHGPAGVGKSTIATIFARALLCDAPGRRPCGACSSCRVSAVGQHPDLLRVERLHKDDDEDRLTPEDPSLGEGELRGQILISQVRRLSGLAALAPRQGAHRVFLIDPAERMNREAQNALLKTLEEPPRSAVLILITAQPHLLLPTVRSRCFSVPLVALRTGALARLLEARGVERTEALRRSALAAGRPGLALHLDLDALDRQRSDVLGLLASLAAGPQGAAEIAAGAAALAGEDEAAMDRGLELLLTVLRDALRAAESAEGHSMLVHADRRDELARLGRRLGRARTAALVESVEHARRDLRANVNRSLLAESLLAAVAGGPLP